MNPILQEFRLAIRDLLARPAWSALVVAVLGAGLGTVLYVLAVINGLVIRPLPFAEPDQLYVGGTQYQGDDDLDSVPQRDADDLARRLAGTAQVAGWSDGTINLVDGERVERHEGSFVTPNLFATLGVQPLLGAGFVDADAAPGAPVRVAIGYDLWQTRYLGDPGVIGRAVRVNGESATIAAVMPQRFLFPRFTAVWMVSRGSTTPTRGDDRPMQLAIRVPDAAALPAVRGAFDAWHAAATREDPNAFRDTAPAVQAMNEFFIDAQTRAILGVMFAATLLVLLVACGNAANLILARQLGRQQELAVRMALGASRRRLAGGMFVHALVLSLCAAAFGLAGAQLAVTWTMDAFASAGDGGPPQWMRFDLDLRMVAFALAAALATALAAGLLPAFKLATGVAGALRDGGRAVAGGGFARLGGVLVMVEIALSAALLIGALATVQNVRALDNFDLGVRTERVLTARLGLFDSQYPDAASRLRLYERLSERLRAEGEVEDVTVSTALPGLNGGNIGLLPESAPATDAPQFIGYAPADARFGSTYGTRLLSGRWIDSRDGVDGHPVALVDRKFVERHGGGGEVVGRRFRLDPGGQNPRVVTVVGVTEALTIDDADDPAEGVMLVPLAQDTPSFVTVAMRVRGDPAAFKPRLAEVMREIDTDTPLYWVRTFDEVTGVANFGQRLLARIYGTFGVIALLLAAGGLYGVVGFTVAQRTREIGVRRALGATPRGVLGTILRRSAWQTGIGLAAGLLLGVPFALALSSSLDGTLALDPQIWLVVAVLLGVVSAAASMVPARRALRVDPMAALRHD
jgi:predicted permease